jgi:hypothetical protein
MSSNLNMLRKTDHHGSLAVVAFPPFSGKISQPGGSFHPVRTLLGSAASN